MLTYPFSVGGIELGDPSPFEGPNGNQEGLSDLGSKQKAVVREYAGGIVTAQLYGSFPKTISWCGKLFGSGAVDRSFELQKLCDNGQQVTLQWSQFSFDGFVEDYQVIARAPNEIDYKMVFRPVVNNSTVTGGNAVANNDPFASTVANGQATMTQQATSPASGGSLSSSIQQGVSSLDQAINQALQQTGGSVSAISSVTAQSLQSQISSLQNQLAPIINGSDPIAASAAADLNGTLSILNVAFGSTLNPSITTIQAVNPNLYQLAAQYYGDPTLYWVIQDANDLSDPLPDTNGPISLVIPVEPTSNTATPATVMNDALAA
jgi:hypothetical protein